MTLDDVLDALVDLFNKYTVLPHDSCAPALALWAVHTHVSPAFYTSPRLVLTSPVPGSGKTRVLELLALVCHSPRMTVGSTTAALFRRIGQAHRDEVTPPTILFDEIDAVFGSNRPSEQTEQLRALMNAGYKRGATIDRCEGDATNMQVIEWPVFSPLALAGLESRLPDTITTRAVVIEMRKRARGETVAPYRERDAVAEVATLVDALAAWAPGAVSDLQHARPAMPEGVYDRPSEVWEPLLAIADYAGGRWPTLAREACVRFVTAPVYRAPSLGVELLHDIREVMGHGSDPDYPTVDRIGSVDLLAKLRDREESPWRDLDHGRGLNARRLGQFMAAYQVASIPVRIGGRTCKGYVTFGNEKQVGLADAWARYLDDPMQKSVTSVTSVTPQVNGTKSGNPEASVTDTLAVTSPGPVTEKPPLTSEVTGVTDVTDFAGHEGRGLAADPVETALLEALSETRPRALGALMKEVREVTGNGATVPDVLDRLAAAGRATETTPNHWTKTRRAA